MRKATTAAVAVCWLLNRAFSPTVLSLFSPPFFPSSPVLVQVSGIAKEALCGTHPDLPSWQQPLC